MIFFLIYLLLVKPIKKQLLSQVLFIPDFSLSSDKIFIIPCLEIVTCDARNVKRALYHSATKPSPFLSSQHFAVYSGRNT